MKSKVPIPLNVCRGVSLDKAMLDCNPGTKLDSSSTPLRFAFFNLSPLNASTAIETSCKFSERFFAVTTTSSTVSAANIDTEKSSENNIVNKVLLVILNPPN